MILRDSRYEPPAVYQDGREIYIGTRQLVRLDVDEDDRYVRIGTGERIDAFAFRMWGSEFGDAASKLWWVIADINDIVNPFTIKAGMLLRVPTTDRVALEVLL